MKKFTIALAFLLIAAPATMTLADDTKKPDVIKGEKPKATPGWVILEEDWILAFLNDFSRQLHGAREHYRAKQDKAAAAEIDKAIAWLSFAENHAEKATAEDIAIARADLADYSAMLKSGKPVLAKKLDSAFAHASVALAKYHHFQANKAIGRDEMKTAGRHLIAAADLVRSAAQSANQEFGSDVYEIYNNYSPYGYWDESIVFEKGKVEANLASIQSELQRLSLKLESTK